MPFAVFKPSRGRVHFGSHTVYRQHDLVFLIPFAFAVHQCNRCFQKLRSWPVCISRTCNLGSLDVDILQVRLLLWIFDKTCGFVVLLSSRQDVPFSLSVVTQTPNDIADSLVKCLQIFFILGEKLCRSLLDTNMRELVLVPTARWFHQTLLDGHLEALREMIFDFCLVLHVAIHQIFHCKPIQNISWKLKAKTAGNLQHGLHVRVQHLDLALHNLSDIVANVRAGGYGGDIPCPLVLHVSKVAFASK
mmetsp:Transcript_28416/g.46992  ORF Transcript_28416/g.46992 Transcript_28416/m.46992 type:complete len:247 (+) Transcript_28416:569-1309(+)